MSVNCSKKYFVLAKICDKRGHVLSIGWNSYVKTHPLCSKHAKKTKCYSELLHAESHAIIRLRPWQRDKAYSITVYRFHENGKPALAKPCPICQSMIRASGIKHIYYTTEDDCLDLDFNTYKNYKDEYKDV